VKRRALLLGCLLVTIGLPQAPTFKTEVNLLSLGVRVTDAHGRDVTGLPQSSFSLLEDNVPQHIAFFAAEKQPVTLGILLDTSSSMRAGGKIDHAKAALRELIAASHPDSEFFFMEFSNNLGDIVELTGNPQRLSAAISSAAASRSGTALYDAVAVALCRLRNARHMRQALIVVTDGADQHSRLNIDQLLRVVQSARAQVYMIGDFSADDNDVFHARTRTITLVSGRQIDNPILVFEGLARESGAESYFPLTPAQLRRAIDAVASELETQYTLGYYPASSPPAYRHIQVKVAGRRLKVQTRRGFSTADDGVHFRVDACALSAEQHPYPYESKLTHKRERLAYQEDFTDPRSGWPFGETSWYGSGEYHILQKGRMDAPAEGVVRAYGPWWNDLRASLTAKLSVAPSSAWPPATQPAAGLVFRLNEHGYYALLVTGGSPGVYAKLIANRYGTQNLDLLPWTRVPEVRQQPAQITQWNTLRVECLGEVMTLYVNDMEIGKVRDARFHDGHVGMTLFGPGHAVFRDLIAEELQ
jgi:Ca-activated chloride channel family protein